MQAFDFNQLQNLLDICFQTKNYIQNFPQIFKQQNSSHFIYIKNNHNIISFCTIYPTYFYSQTKLYTGYCVGSVCTHPDDRGKGLASRVLLEAEKKIRSINADFIYLFSEENKLYENAGYKLCGKSFMAEINPNSKCLKIDLNQNHYDYKIEFYEDLKNLDENIILKFWNFIVKNSKPSESILSCVEFQSILKIKNMKIYCCLHKNKLNSLCFLNKGDDFQNVVHGVYFLNVESIHFILKYIVQQNHISPIYFFPGVFYPEFKNLFEYESLPTMYLNVLQNPSEKIISLVENYAIYPRSLQGT